MTRKPKIKIYKDGKPSWVEITPNLKIRTYKKVVKVSPGDDINEAIRKAFEVKKE